MRLEEIIDQVFGLFLTGFSRTHHMRAALAVAGALTALFCRQMTGEGQMVDIATNDAITAWQNFQVVWGFTSEKPRDRIAGFDWYLYPYGFLKCQDGYVL